MGIVDDFKRLFWVKKAVAESAAEKAGEKAKEAGEELSEQVSQAWEKSKDFAEEVGEKITTKVKEVKADLWDKKDDWTQKEPPAATNEATPTEKAGEKIGETTAKTWDKVKEEGKELLEKAVNTTDKVWEKTEEVSEDLWNKTKKVADNVNQKFNEGVDSMLEKAKALDKKIEEETDKIDPNRDGWADKTVREKMKEHESDLKGKDDFFERANRYADGDYSMGKPIVTKKGDEGEATEEGMTPLPPLPKDDDFADDAILDDGEDKK